MNKLKITILVLIGSMMYNIFGVETKCIAHTKGMHKHAYAVYALAPKSSMDNPSELSPFALSEIESILAQEPDDVAIIVRSVFNDISRETLHVSKDIEINGDTRFGGLRFTKDDHELIEHNREGFNFLLSKISMHKKRRKYVRQALDVVLEIAITQKWYNFEAVEFGLEILRREAAEDDELLQGDIDSARKTQTRKKAFDVLIEQGQEDVFDADDTLLSALQLSAIGNMLDLTDPFIAKQLTRGKSLFDIYNEHRPSVASSFWATRATVNFQGVDAGMKRIKAASGKKVLLLADNVGEDVFDLPLLKELLDQDSPIAIAGKSRPSYNDATIDDLRKLFNNKSRLRQFFGDEYDLIYKDKINRFVTLVDSGTIGLGLDLGRFTPEIKKVWGEADLIIAKGTANYNSLRRKMLTKDVLYLAHTKAFNVDVFEYYSVGTNICEYVPALRFAVTSHVGRASLDLATCL